MSAARGAFAVAALRNWMITVRDAEQAYIQASLICEGVPLTWVRLPRSWWPPAWEKLYKDPVVLLCKAFYGHPESGAVWEQHIKRQLLDLQWEPVEAWPSVWVMAKERFLLIVYVDDLLLGCSRSQTAAVWKSIEERVRFGEEPQQLSR